MTAARRGVAFGVVALAGVLALAFAFVLVRAGPAGSGRVSPQSSLSLEQARAFREFQLFSAGDGADGLPLTAVLRRDDTASYVSFVYGDCDAEDETGCAPSAEVQVWPLCRRSLALYDGEAAWSPVPERVVTRGVPGAFFDGGTRLELETGRSLVVVFADSRARVLRIAGELEAVDGSVGAGEPLPLPPAGRGRGGAMDC